MLTSDTIAAVSSAPGGALRGIVRLSGPDAWPLALSQIENRKSKIENSPAPRRPHLVTLTALPLPAMLLLFRAPHSFTGQDIAELHLPGSPALLRMILDDLLRRARQAGPGEFTAEAFFHGKIDLTEAEGIAATIAAANDRQLRAAAALRDGTLHKWIAKLADQIADDLARLEAGIDFSEEEHVAFITPNALIQATDCYVTELHRMLAHATRVDRLDSPPTVVFIGKPNVGKSSLINALTRSDRSIVSPVPGTTRDMLTALLRTTHGDIHIVDVPGEEPADDELRAEMMQARDRALLEADLIVEVMAPPDRASSTDLTMPVDAPAHVIEVQNKVDLLTAAERQALVYREFEPGQKKRALREWQLVSAKTGKNVQELASRIAHLVTAEPAGAVEQVALNQRHRTLLQEAKQTLREAGALANEANEDPVSAQVELLAADLRHALDLLGQISGVVSPDDILGRIFSSFCIGK